MQREHLIMKQSSIEQQTTSLTPQTEGLTTPHFDDSAVATAHQVEPLPQRPANRFESLRTGLTIASAMAMGIVLGIGAVVISSGSRAGNAALPVFAEASAQMDSVDESVAQASAMDSSAGPDSSMTQQKSQAHLPRFRARRTLGRYMAEDFGDDDDDYSSRRSARKVGVIYYGRTRGAQY
jgi:hypothetical protein